MPKRGAFALVMTALALVLLLNFRTPTEIAAVGGGVQRPGAVGTSGGTGSGTAAGQQAVTGPVVNTRWGPVQVEITVANGRLTDIQALQLPNGDRRSASISSRVEPTLRSQALQAQSATIDGVSGATYTSIAYARSLQAALDTAGL
jgi:uncharacterized protein with FMN-binding domain